MLHWLVQHPLLVSGASAGVLLMWGLRNSGMLWDLWARRGEGLHR